jgi:DNA-nicking Smr family endonuclease
MRDMAKGPEKPDQDPAADFRAAVEDVAPLRSDRADPYRARRRPEPIRQPEDDAQDSFADLAVETGDFLEFRRPGIQNRVFHDLQRGVIEAEASLDLHGMRVREAAPALARFLAFSLTAGRRCVRIIHGKGRGSDGRQPVLKQKVNQWLRQRDEVLAFVSAPRWDGGSGAVYVLLARKRSTGRV